MATAPMMLIYYVYSYVRIQVRIGDITRDMEATEHLHQRATHQPHDTPADHAGRNTLLHSCCYKKQTHKKQAATTPAHTPPGAAARFLCPAPAARCTTVAVG